MHRAPLFLVLVLHASAAAAQLHPAADTVPAERRESPASGAVVRPDSLPPGVARTLPELLAARVPGVFVERSSGVVGAGSRVRLRGAGDMLAPQDPLVVVDGVRYAADQNSLLVAVGGQRPSRLDDLDPEDVERVRVLHGPAAAALYGPAGAGGVIEVLTRRGESGPRVRAFASAGVRTDPASYPANYRQVGVVPGGARDRACTLQARAAGACTPRPDSLVSSNPLEDAGPFRAGVLRAAGVSVGGTTSLASYYVAADADRETGVVAASGRERTDLRANLAVRPLRGVEVAGTLGQRRGRLELPPTDGNTFNPVVDGLTASPLDPAGPDGYPPPWNGGRTQTSTQDVAHTTFGVRGEWRPLPWLAATALLGEDRLDRDERQEHRAEGGALEQEQDAREDRRLRTAGAGATASLGLGRGLASTTVAGWERVTDRAATHSRTESPGGGWAEESSRSRLETAAWYLAQRLAWRDRVVLEAAARRERLAALPDGDARWSRSLGAAWRVVRGAAGDGVRLRAAYGSIARELPVAAFFLAPACPPAETCELEPGAVHEAEAGVDASLRGGRLGISLTGYGRETRDALAVVPYLGGGIFREAVDNVGRVANRGVEAALRADLLAGPRVSWSMDLVVSANRNRLEGPEEEFAVAGVGPDQQHRRGYPLGGYFAPPIAGWADRNGDGVIGVVGCPGPACEVQVGERGAYLGSPVPTRTAALGSRLGLWGRVGVYARLEHQGGARLLNQTRLLRCTVFDNCREAYDPATPLEDQAAIVAQALGTNAGFIEEADFVRLREVSLVLAVPAALARRVGAGGLDLALVGHDLATWTGYSGPDPEVNTFGQAPFRRADRFAQPHLRRWDLRLDVRR